MTSATSLDDFVRRLSKVVVGQVCKEELFQSAQQTALDTLVDVLQRYISEIGRRSHAYTQTARRTESSFYDVRLALQELGVSVDDVYGFVCNTAELPFARLPVPEFPALVSSSSSRRSASTAGAVLSSRLQPPQQQLPPASSSEMLHEQQQLHHHHQQPSAGAAAAPPGVPPAASAAAAALPSEADGEEDGAPEVPDFLPRFPEPHTYSFSPVPSGGGSAADSDVRALRKLQAKQKRQVEEALARLGAQLGAAASGLSYESATVAKKKASKANAYLQPPKPAAAAAAVDASSASSAAAASASSLSRAPAAAAAVAVPPAATPLDRERESALFEKAAKGGEARVVTEWPDDEVQSTGRQQYTDLENAERAKKRQRSLQILEQATLPVTEADQ